MEVTKKRFCRVKPIEVDNDRADGKPDDEPLGNIPKLLGILSFLSLDVAHFFDDEEDDEDEEGDLTTIYI